MTNYEAAKLIVEMSTDVRLAGYGREDYCEAVALACAALFNQTGHWEYPADKEE